MAMINSTFSLFLLIGGTFGLIAGLIAYFITYNEWMHHYTTKKEPRKIALETASFAFLFFFILSVLIGLFYRP